MYASDDEKVSDEMLGEAVLNLLKRDATVSIHAVTVELQALAGAEANPVRRAAYQRTCAEVQRMVAEAAAGRRSGGTESNIITLFSRQQKTLDDHSH